MKYMHFNSSCSYAGLANMLELLHYDTEDYIIALDIGLPYFIRCDSKSNCYQAGAMLQSKEWFDLYLKPRGFSYVEKVLPKEEAVCSLCPGRMLGIQVSARSKHAVVCMEATKEEYSFLNNKRKDTPQEEVLRFSKEELLKRLPEETAVGYVEACDAEEVNFLSYYKESVLTWKKLKKELNQFTASEQGPQSLQEARDRLFRPLLVDSLAMMRLLGQQELVLCLESLQTSFLNTVKKNQPVVLADEFDCFKFDEVIERIVTLIEKKSNKLA
ncbi:MAG: hypothetical protein ACI4FZ_07365 [Lachnospiraceae bacterium]